MSIVGRKRKLKERETENTANEEQQSGTGSTSSPPESQPIDEDTVVKSHAALRKERKHALKQVKNGDTNENPKNGKVSELRTKPPSTRQNSVWVGNLAYKTTQDSLRKFFDGVGEITRIHMPTKNTGHGGKKFNVQGDNLGFAYVDFATADAKTIAITLSETNLSGRKLLIKDGDDFTGRPSAPAVQHSIPNPIAKTENPTAVPQPGHSKFAQRILKKQKQPPAPTLFMGNLPFEIGAEDIRSMLLAHRDSRAREEDEETEGGRDAISKPGYLRIRLGTFEDSGKCKGWAFLDFADNSEATAALTNPRNHRMNGRDLVLEYASPDAVRRGGRLNRKDAERPRKKTKLDKATTLRAHYSKPWNGKEDPKAEEGTVSQPEHRDRERTRKDGKTRPRPGAALAMAKRENVAIVQSEGKKIKF